jgi:hypothetical protein
VERFGFQASQRRMLGRRQPVDLAVTTKDIKLRIERVLANLEPVTQQLIQSWPTRALFGWISR